MCKKAASKHSPADAALRLCRIFFAYENHSRRPCRNIQFSHSTPYAQKTYRPLCVFLFLPQKEGLKIVHPCTIFNSSFCKAVRFAKTSITYSVSGIHVGAQASGTDSAARLGDEFALRQTSQISGFKFAILKNCSHMRRYD